MTVANEFAWAYSHAYDRVARNHPRHHNKDGGCPFCAEERRRV